MLDDLDPQIGSSAPDPHESHELGSAPDFVAKLCGRTDSAGEPRSPLYAICERKRRAAGVLAYNGPAKLAQDQVARAGVACSGVRADTVAPLREPTNMTTTQPLVVVIAGPNGAGKSTTAPALLGDALQVQEFVNADAIALGLSGLRPESVALAAGRVMLARLKQLARQRADFAFETTLASRTFAPWLDELRGSGYRAHLAFLALPSVELALGRVAERVRLGGHNVSEDVIRRRFAAGLRNFFSLYRQRVDSWQLFDNSGLGPPALIASCSAGETMSLKNLGAWENLLEIAQCQP